MNDGGGLRPVRGFAPDPAGAAPLRPALKSKTFLEAKTSGGMCWQTWGGRKQRPYRNLKSERRPDGGASLLVQAHRSIIKCCIAEGAGLALLNTQPPAKRGTILTNRAHRYTVDSERFHA